MRFRILGASLGKKKNKNIKFLPFIKEAEQKYIFFVSPPKNRL